MNSQTLFYSHLAKKVTVISSQITSVAVKYIKLVTPTQSPCYYGHFSLVARVTLMQRLYCIYGSGVVSDSPGLQVAM